MSVTWGGGKARPLRRFGRKAQVQARPLPRLELPAPAVADLPSPRTETLPGLAPVAVREIAAEPVRTLIATG